MNVFKLSEIINEISSNFDVKITLKSNCSFIAINSARSVFNNILENAVRHGQATEIEIESEILRNDCEIRIKNNGNNIPEKILSRIFNEGFKHGKFANTGIGLSIVKKIMTQSRGSVSVKANQPQGVVFILTFKKFVINK
jgi:signal transduction histidine kinase